MMATIIVNQRFRDHEILRKMSVTNVRVGGAILPDIIFPGCVPSLAVAFCEATKLNEGMLKRLRDIEKQFKSAVGIVIGIDDDEMWTTFQLTADLTMMTLFRVADCAEAAELALQCNKELGNTEKFDLQTTYFNHERERMSSAATARAIMTDTLRELGIPDTDVEILLDGFPTMRRLIGASAAELIENSPASLDSIKQIAALFQSSRDH